MDFLNIIQFCFFICFGACVGSFLTMAVYRLPRNEDIIFQESYCPICKKKIKKLSLIPILSFIFQKGKCSECGAKINPRYLIIELINTLLYITVYFYYGFTFLTFYLTLLFSLILLISFIDFNFFKVNPKTIIALFVFAILHIIFTPNNVLMAIFSMFLYYLVIYISEKILKLLKNTNTDFIGGGDEKIIIICGCFLGIEYLGLFFLMSGFIGLLTFSIRKFIFRKKINKFPFAPSLLISLYILLNFYYYTNK